MAEIKHLDERQAREDRFMLAYSSRDNTAHCDRESMVAGHEAGLAVRKQLDTLQPNTGKETLAKTCTMTSSQER